MTVDYVIDHLWQSTIVAAAIALLTLAFRRSQAQTRYWIWFAASLKFLIPFAALAALGARLEWRDALPAAPPEWTFAIEVVSQPFSAPDVNVALPRAIGADDSVPLVAGAAAAIWILGSVTILTVWLLRWRRVSAAVRAGAPISSGRVRDAFHRLEGFSRLPLVASDTSLEPGVFGIVRPVLLWPRDIDVRLDDAQVHAILAHELAHVRRRDNLTAGVHMLVEAVFWFHPLVWWIGARLVNERERACDEEVVRLGNEPHVYAESILKTCQFFVESPLSCVSGVTGSDLKKRIERIMADRPATRLNAWRKTALATAAAVTLAAPVAIGALSAPRLPGMDTALTTGNPVFEKTTVKPNKTGAMRVVMQMVPGGAWEATNVTLESMIRLAYRLQDFQVMGGPRWITSERFDILAKSAAGAPPSEFPQRMRSLLAEQFNLKVHSETRELPIYALVRARADGSRGPRLTPSTVDCEALARGEPGERPACGITVRFGHMRGSGVTMSQLVRSLAQQTGRTVLDRTGLTGGFDYDLEFAPDPTLVGRGTGPGGGLPRDPVASQRAPESDGVSIFAAVQEQLGLRLDPQRAPVDVLVIDAAEQPTEN